MQNSFVFDFKNELRMLVIVMACLAVLFGLSTFSYLNSTAQAATPTTTKSGNWSDPTVWTTGIVPGATDSVTIAAGHTVTYNVLSNAVLGQIDIYGTLTFSRATNTRLKTSDNIFVRTGGFLDMGTEANPIPKGINAEVIFVLPQGYTFTGGSTFQAADKGLWAMAGRWEVHGAPLIRTWSKLAADAAFGSSVITVENNVTDWYMGGTVVVTQTTDPLRVQGRCHYKLACAYVFENEVRKITALQSLPGGKTQITLDQPLQYAHHGVGNIRGEVGLLTRNILVRTEVTGVSDSILDGDLARRRFAHTMLMGNATGKIQYAEFKYMGHLATLARYPIHLHMTGTAGNSVVVRGNSIWRSGNRGYQAHNTQGPLIEDNVAFDTTMSPFYIERSGHPGQIIDRNDPGEAPNNIWLVHNLGVQSSQAPIQGSAQQNDDAIFWFDQLDQIVLGNVAVAGGAWGSGVATGSPVGNGEGFWIDERSADTGNIHTPVFLKNETHSNSRSGWVFWHVGSQPYEFSDILSWRNGWYGIDWGYYRSQHKIFNAKLIENPLAGLFSSQSGVRYVQDSEIIDSYIGADDNVTRPVYPDNPMTYVRMVMNNSYIRRGIANDALEETAPIATRSQSGNYVAMLNPTFKNIINPIDFAGQATVGNRNGFWRIKDAVGLDSSLPNDFLLFRQDQQDPAKQTNFSSPFLAGTKTWNNALNGLVVPVSQLASTITVPIWGNDGSTGSLTAAGDLPKAPYVDYTFKNSVDYPPQVSLQVLMNGKVASLTASASDDKAVTKVEFWLDDKLVSTDITAPYTVSIDLSSHPRKYAYFYAIAYDGTITSYRWANTPSAPRNEDFIQKAYSKTTEIGPEVILAGQMPSSLPSPFTISSLSRLHLFLDSLTSITITGSGFSTADDFRFRMKNSTGTVKIDVQVKPTTSTTIVIDLVSLGVSTTGLDPGFYGIELERVSDGVKTSASTQFLITRLGDLWSSTATSSSLEPRDGKIDIHDVSRLLSKWGSTDVDADINGPTKTSDGVVDIYDANKLMANWTG